MKIPRVLFVVVALCAVARWGAAAPLMLLGEATDVSASPGAEHASGGIRASYEAYLKAQEQAFRSNSPADLASAATLRKAVEGRQDAGERLYASSGDAFQALKIQQDLLDKVRKGSVEYRMATVKIEVATREMTPPMKKPDGRGIVRK